MQRLEAYFPQNVAEITLSSLTQWDKDVLLHIKGEELPENFEIHIGYDGISEAYRFPMQKTDGVATVKIPNALFTQTSNIKAWTYVIDSEGCRTTKTIIIPLAKREKPADYTSSAEPSDRDIIQQAIEAAEKATQEANELVTRSAEAAEKATQEANELVTRVSETFQEQTKEFVIISRSDYDAAYQAGTLNDRTIYFVIEDD